MIGSEMQVTSTSGSHMSISNESSYQMQAKIDDFIVKFVRDPRNMMF